MRTIAASLLLLTGAVGTNPHPSVAELPVTCADATYFGDFDGDGSADAVIADPSAKAGGVASIGEIIVAYGRPDWPVPDRTEVLRQGDGIVPGKGKRGDHFGKTLEVGYVDGDQCADVLIGVPGERVGGAPRAGAVVVLFGSDDGLGRGRAPVVWTERNFGDDGVPERGDRFGSGIAMPNTVNSDGRAVVLATPDEDLGDATDAGAVVFAELDEAGSIVNESYRLITQDVEGLGDTPEDDDRFGTAVSFTHYEDRSTLLFVGTPNESVGGIANAGVVDVITDLGPGQAPRGVRWTEDDLGDESVQAGDRFGAAVQFEVDGFTGISKLAIGAPGEHVGAPKAGRVYLLFDDSYEQPAERLYVFDQSVVDFAEEPEAGDQFGASLITLGRYVSGSQSILFIGVPGEDIDGASNAGLVHRLPVDVVDLERVQTIHQNIPGVPGRAGANDRFGAILGGRPQSGIDSPGAALIGLPHDSDFPDGAVMMVPLVPVDESDPTEPRYDVRIWLPGRGAFPARGIDFGGAAAGAHGDFP